ncbi:MAG: arsenate reductase ArsC [Kiritimatiellales bacterium]|nr:arsenate reductase ArsC [Kiritimatiellales bacterium]
MSKKLKILFLCTGNSCRSQMAEGWAHALKSDEFEAYSAGIETHGLNPNAVKVMAEVGVNITGQKSENIADLLHIPIDVVITVCSHAAETCPIFPGTARVIHHGFDDPPKLARKLAAQGATEEEQLDCYRRVRDEIKAFVAQLPGNLEENAS